METKNIATTSCLMFLLGYFLVVVPLSFWTDRNLEFWLSHFKGQEVEVPFWVSFLATAVSNGVGILANVLGEICRLAV